MSSRLGRTKALCETGDVVQDWVLRSRANEGFGISVVLVEGVVVGHFQLFHAAERAPFSSLVLASSEKQHPIRLIQETVVGVKCM